MTEPDSTTDGSITSDSTANGERRGAVRMTAFAPHGAERAVALGPAGPTAARLARTVRAAVVPRKAAAAAGAGVGLAVLGMGSYALGRRAERRARGPLTRLTRGRF
ncbi:hypothetical protein [Streptomyces sp. NPDC047000]|uniref:hypothetical protein n=1 Tax=Streptomyces sp. NPDC047000 TaxID=3155474 RepID=UPI0033E251FD